MRCAAIHRGNDRGIERRRERQRPPRREAAGHDREAADARERHASSQQSSSCQPRFAALAAAEATSASRGQHGAARRARRARGEQDRGRIRVRNAARALGGVAQRRALVRREPRMRGAAPGCALRAARRASPASRACWSRRADSGVPSRAPRASARSPRCGPASASCANVSVRPPIRQRRRALAGLARRGEDARARRSTSARRAVTRIAPRHGSRLNLRKSGLRFSRYAFCPSWPSSDR